MSADRNKWNIGNEQSLSNIIQAIEELVKTDFVSSSELLNNDFQNILSRLKDNTLRVAIVGGFSSGKSTFLNALMGMDILKHGTKETTATITEIENNPNLGKEIKFDAYYLNGRKEENLPIEKLEEYTSTSSRSHQVANEIAKVVIKCNIFESKFPICFIDTPGLNGVADNHREITIEQVKHSHLCIYLMHGRGLDQSDLDFINFLSRYQRSFIFVQNFIDKLNELEGDNVENKLKKQKEILDDLFEKSKEKIDYQILGVSSLKALIAREEIFKEYKEQPLTQQLRQQLYQESGFEQIKKEIFSLLTENQFYILQKKNSIEVALQLMNQLYEVTTYRKEIEDQEWRDSPEAKKQEYYREILDKLQTDKKTNVTKLSNYVYSEADQIQFEVMELISERIDSIKEVIKKEIENIVVVNEFEIYTKTKFSQSLNVQVAEVEDDSNKFMSVAFGNLLREAVFRIKDYSGVSAKSSNVGSFKIKNSISSEQYKGYTDEDQRRVKELQEELAKKQINLQFEKRKMAEMSEKIKNLDTKKSLVASKISQTKNQKNREIEYMGARPAAEKKYKDKTEFVPHGGFGFIDAIWGYKKIITTESYFDYTKQNEWDRKKNIINNNYNAKIHQFNSQLRAIELEINNFENDICHIKNMEPAMEMEIQHIQEDLNSQKKYIKVQEEMAKKEYLKALKCQLLSEVDDYLKLVSKNMTVNFKDAVWNNREHIKTLILDIFDKAMKEQIQLYKGYIENGQQNTVSLQSQDFLDKLQQSMQLLELAL